MERPRERESIRMKSASSAFFAETHFRVLCHGDDFMSHGEGCGLDIEGLQRIVRLDTNRGDASWEQIQGMLRNCSRC